MTLPLKLSQLEPGKVYFLHTTPYVFYRKADVQTYWDFHFESGKAIGPITGVTRRDKFWDFLERIENENMLVTPLEHIGLFICLEQEGKFMRILTWNGLIGWIANKPWYEVTTDDYTD
jgi:hypothetical protein